MSDDTVDVDIDIDGPFTVNEIIEIEALCGGRLLSDLSAERPGVYLRAAAYVLGRRNNPALTLEAAGELMVRFDG